MQDFKFEPGDKVKDAVTGFTGIVMARSQYLTGCNRYGVQSDKLHKTSGAPGEWQNFDKNVLKIVKKAKVKLETGYESKLFKKKKRKEIGGPPVQEAMRY